MLLDIKMPRMDGLQVLRDAEGRRAHADDPGGDADLLARGGDLLESYTLGVNSYIVKPVDFEQFAETVAQVGMYWVLANQTVAGC